MKWEDGQPDGQTYGYHSVYLKREVKNFNWHMVLLRSINGLLVEYNVNSNLTYKLIGGNLEFKFFLGDNMPETVVK